MYQLVLIIHVMVAIILIGLVLLQRGKGADVGAAFGAGASQTVFGSQGAGSFLLRITTLLAGVFFATSLALGYIAAQQHKQVQEVKLPVSAPVEEPEKKDTSNDAANSLIEKIQQEQTQ